MTTLTNPHDFNIENYIFKLKTVDGKHQVRFQNKSDGSLCTLKSPYVIFPFEPSSYSKSKGATENIQDWSIDIKAACYETLDLSKVKDKDGNSVSFNSEQNKQGIKEMFEAFKQIREKAIDFLAENSQKIWKKEVKREIIEEAYISKLIKESDKTDNDGNPYPDRVTCKIMKGKEGNPEIVIEDFEGNPIDISSWDDIEEKMIPLVPKGSAGRIILQIRTSIVNSKFFITLKLCALQIDDKSKSRVNSVFTFREENSNQSKTVTENSNDVEDSEEEEEDDDEDEEVDVEEA